jgi:hypothetical protein
VVFHFNKMHLQDPTVPMWTIKHKGQTYYVHHMEVLPGIGFSTKETPDNPHTKGSLRIKGCLKIEEDNGVIQATVY